MMMIQFYNNSILLSFGKFHQMSGNSDDELILLLFHDHHLILRNHTVM